MPNGAVRLWTLDAERSDQTWDLDIEAEITFYMGRYIIVNNVENTAHYSLSVSCPAPDGARLWAVDPEARDRCSKRA